MGLLVKGGAQVLQFLLSALLLGGILSRPTLSFAQTSIPDGSYVAGELLIAPKPGVSDSTLESLYKSHGGQKIKTLSQINVHHVKVPAQSLDAIESALRGSPRVQFVEKNYVAQTNLVPNDPGYPSQWHLSKISATAGWDITTGSPNVPVAVIDSGVDPAHPDLASNLIPGHNFLSGNTDTHDVLGHGTAVAGTAAAVTNDGIGVAGVAWFNTIMPLVVVSSSNYATYADIATAVNYAADHSVKVINMSLGGTSYSSTLQSAVNYAWSKGLVIVAAAGNNSSSAYFYPAALSNVVAVSATDGSDNPASFTNFGNWITVAAPGTSIYTTTNGGGYGNWQGTSFSAPQVAALAALLFSRNPALTNQKVVDLIKNNADDLGATGFDPYYGWGRINVYRALAAAQTVVNLSVSLTSPSNNSTVTGLVTVSASVSSQNPIAKVEFYVDGALNATDTTNPYSFTWDTTGLSGSHTLFAKAYDSAGNTATSPTTTVNVGSIDTTPPDVQITGIFNSGKSLTVNVSASDTQSAVTKVELYIDGVLKATDNSAPWSFKINTKPLKPGNHSVQARGYDSLGNMGVSGSVTVTTY